MPGSAAGLRREIMAKYQLLTATSMGVRITPANRQPVGTGNLYPVSYTHLAAFAFSNQRSQIAVI